MEKVSSAVSGVRRIADGKLLCSTEAWPGTLWWPGGMRWGGGEEDQRKTRKGQCVCIIMAALCCCMEETNTTQYKFFKK